MDGHRLWSLMVDVLTSASDPNNSATKTVEDAAQEVLSGSFAVGLSAAEASFLMDCVTGACRFRPLCEGALQGYCDHLKRNKADRLSMHLIAYVLIFQLQTLTSDRLRQLLQNSTSMPRLSEYLSYLVDREAVVAHSVPLWMQSYDDTFVKGTVLTKLDRASDAVRSLVEVLNATAAGPARTLSSLDPKEERRDGPSAPLTSSRSALATSAEGVKARRKAAPSAPSEGSHQPTHSPQPQHWRAKERGSTDETRKRRLPPAEVREMAHTLPEPRPPRVKLPVIEDTGKATPSVTAAPLAKPPPTKPVGFAFLQREAMRTKDTSPVIASPSPPPFVATDIETVRQRLERPVEVPWTNAALRREAHTHQQRRAEEEKALQELAMHQRDSSAFEQWRQAELAKEEHQRELLILERHLQALQTEENVRAARAEEEQRRRKVFRSMKQAAASEAQRRQAEEERQASQQRSLVLSLREELARSRREAEERLAEEKLKAAEEVKQESEEVRRTVRAAEEQRRVEQAVVIQEIRLLRERVRQKQAELREQRRAGGGSCEGEGGANSPMEDDALLCAMTPAQLQLELERVRAHDRELEEARREGIRAAKAKEAAERAALADLCQAERAKRRQDRDVMRRQREATAAAVRAAQLEAETDRMMTLQQQLDEKRSQRRLEAQKARDAERQRRNEAHMRAADDAAMERERWRQLEQGLVNRITATQKGRSSW